MNNVRVLHLGWKPQQSLEALLALGSLVDCAVTMTDAERARASDLQTNLLVVGDVSDPRQVLAALIREFGRLPQYDYVTAANEMEIESAAVLAKCLGASSFSVESAISLRDKFVQKIRIAEHGIPCARSKVLFLPWCADPLELPVVVKPLNGCGSAATAVLTNGDEWDHWLKEADRGAPWLAETFVAGQEGHIDGFIQKGELGAILVSEYLSPLVQVGTGKLGGSISFAPAESVELYARARQFVGSVLEALDYTNGVFHLEYFINDSGEFIFSELGARVGGASVAQSYANSFGTSLDQVWASLVLDQPVPAQEPFAPSHPYFGQVQLTAAGVGVVRKIPSLEELRGLPNVVHAVLRSQVGAHVLDPRTCTSHCMARLVIGGSSFEEVRQRLYAAETWFQSVVEVN